MKKIISIVILICFIALIGCASPQKMFENGEYEACIDALSKETSEEAEQLRNQCYIELAKQALENGEYKKADNLLTNTSGEEAEQIKNECYLCTGVRNYTFYLKDPESLMLRGTISIIESEGERYAFFTASANNTFGGKVTSIPMFRNYDYLGDYNDKAEKTIDEFLEMSEKEQDN